MADDEKTDAQWKAELTPEQYSVTREGGTERAFTGKFYKHAETGAYACVCCGAQLFRSDTKYESGSGWPSFYEPVTAEALKLIDDHTHGMTRTEVRCAACDAHLGHVFPDGPRPSGLRYCINSVSLDFDRDD